jgi:hypothetical protein
MRLDTSLYDPIQLNLTFPWAAARFMENGGVLNIHTEDGQNGTHVQTAENELYISVMMGSEASLN